MGRLIFENIGIEYRGSLEFTDTDLISISMPEKIKKLLLENCRITDSGLKSIAELFPQLVVLDLDTTGITDSGLKHLKYLTNLKELWIESTNISDAGCKNLVEIKNLEFLSLLDTDISDAGLKELRKFLPNCELHY